MIPKIIHYIWVGSSEMPERNRQLIEKNTHLCPEYKIKIWGESDLPSMTGFPERAYYDKKWAFVSDYFRFQLLLQHGGIYLDTDMELLKPLDDLLYSPGFSGYNQEADYIYCGIIGSTPGHPFIKDILDAYDRLHIGEYPTSPEMMTNAYKRNSEIDFQIYPASYFYPLQAGEKLTQKKIEHAYATHHWDESWRTFVPLRRFLRRIYIIPVYHFIKRTYENIRCYPNR